MSQSSRSTRISNQYLLRILSVVVRLGRHDVSAQVLVEAWKSDGSTADDRFFLHFDVLFEYGFLAHQADGELLSEFESLMAAETPLDIQFSITQNGENFLERYLQP